jgi:hypothetical protein
VPASSGDVTGINPPTAENQHGRVLQARASIQPAKSQHSPGCHRPKTAVTNQWAHRLTDGPCCANIGGGCQRCKSSQRVPSIRLPGHKWWVKKKE